MIIPVTKLPSNFKPYTFKSFKLKAITLKQAIDLNKNPTLKDISELIQELADNTIDASKLVPIDVKYILAMLAFHAFPNQSWSLDLICPHCKGDHKQSITMKDFPPVPSLTDDDPYPLTIDDGKHVYEIGYPSIESFDNLTDKMSARTGTDVVKMESTADYLDVVEPYILSIDGDSNGIREKLLDLEDFGVLGLILEAIRKYFTDETYSEFICPKCHEKYSVPLSAVEVTQYTPFLDKAAIGKYKTNFRI